MLRLDKNSKKKNLTNFIKIDNLNSYKELIGKDKKVIKIKGIGKKKNKNLKELKKPDNIKVKAEKKTKFSLGEIKIAKIHKKANRPLKLLKDLSKEEIKNNSCPCCGLPTAISGKLEEFKMGDSPDEFSNCGEGVILYFSFFKFCIFVTFIATIGMSCFDSYISYNYYYELQKICANLPKNHSDIIYKCEVYSEDIRLLPGAKHDNTPLFNSFFFKISLVNFRNYKLMSKFFEEIYSNNKF